MDQIVDDATATLTAIRGRLQRGPLESIADRKALVNFIDAALRKDEGADAFAVFCARAAARHLADRCGDLYCALRDLIAAEDRFVREAGRPLDDPIADAVEQARPLIEGPL